MYFFEKALKFIFPPNCGVCGKLGEGYLCAECGKKLEKYVIDAEIYSRKSNMVGNSNKPKMANGKEETNERFHLFQYKELVRNLLLDYKFNDKSYLYKTFCEFIVKNKKSFDFIKSYDIIIPVPMHPVKIRKRGYNQSELIAKELAKRFRIKTDTSVLIKTKNNKIQSTLNKKEREENTKNVYSLVKPEKIENKKVLLLDDIYTTGATVNACVKELQKAKKCQVGIFTLARD